jgi:hypothetical protein
MCRVLIQTQRPAANMRSPSALMIAVVCVLVSLMGVNMVNAMELPRDTRYVHQYGAHIMVCA